MFKNNQNELADKPKSWGDLDKEVAIFMGWLLGLLLAIFGTKVLITYAWGLFIGIPFVSGALTGALLNRRQTRTVGETARAAMASQMWTGIVLLLLGIEGLICLAMALPLALPLAILGGLTGRMLAKKNERPLPPQLAAGIGLLPLIMVAEYLAHPQPPVHPVTTSIIIDAPVDRVWKNVITFPELAPPTEMIFRTGIAYPTSATIVGTGPGAVRYCHFTTGDFVEPITTWDVNHLLAFSVSKQPEAMREMSPWKIVPAHIEHNYFRSQHGQFRLQPIDASHTLLEGTTWYQDYFWPQQYWNVISDQIVHRIHLRVLKHVKQQAEMGLPRKGDFD